MKTNPNRERLGREGANKRRPAWGARPSGSALRGALPSGLLGMNHRCGSCSSFVPMSLVDAGRKVAMVRLQSIRRRDFLPPFPFLRARRASKTLQRGGQRPRPSAVRPSSRPRRWQNEASARRRRRSSSIAASRTPGAPEPTQDTRLPPGRAGGSQ